MFECLYSGQRCQHVRAWQISSDGLDLPQPRLSTPFLVTATQLLLSDIDSSSRSDINGNKFLKLASASECKCYSLLLRTFSMSLRCGSRVSSLESEQKTSYTDESNIILRSMPPDGHSALASASILTDAKT